LSADIDKPADSPKKSPYDVSAKLALTAGRLQSRIVPNADIAFDGKIDGANIAGNITGDGLIGGEPIDINGTFSKSGDRISLRDFIARIGLSRIDGDIALENSLADGEVSIASNDISSLAALALVDAAGAVNGTVTLESSEGRQNASAQLKLMRARYDTYRVGDAALVARIRDALGTPEIDATIDGKDIDAAGVAVSTLSADASTVGTVSTFKADATLDNNTRVETSGAVDTADGGLEATVDTLSVRSSYGNASLLQPALIVRDGSVTRVENVSLDVAGGRISASGTIGDTISLNSSIENLPLSIANSFRPDLGLGGTLSGDIDVTGSTGDPRVAFSMRANSVDAAQLRSASIAPISANASGAYQGNAVSLTSFDARNSQNLDFTGVGTIPFSGSGLSVKINGSAPLQIAERFLIERGTRTDGTLRIDATVTGSLASPNTDGLFSLSGATITDPLSNLRLTNVGGVAGLRGDTVSISQFSGQLRGGGTVSLGGTIGLSGGLPADLSITLRNATYGDGETIRTTLSGDLAVTGLLTGGPQISGNIDLVETDITIPETLAGEADLLDVRNVNPDAETRKTLARIQAVLPKGDSAGPQAPVRVDITLNSPNRIFIRGRGVDAELGGSLRIVGPLNALQPVGSFNLIRGRLNILSKRLDLTEGRVALTGSLDPLINLVAQVNGDDVTGFIRLTGRASDLSLELESSPELPEDEILARVLFGKSITELSPLQIANLAAAAASLASGGGGGLADQIRQGVGVDDLDLVQDSEGNVAVRAGKYIQDNVYLDVQAGSAGGEVSINLDVTDSLTAKGTVDTDGNSKLGVFFEKDY
jgi:translocation and assembly module TamB